MMRVSVPSYRKIRDDNDTSYTVYCVEVYISGRIQTIEKRYTEFEELHKQLKKTLRTPEFPPKKMLKWNNKVLEQRRHGLQSYLQGIMEADTIPKSFLKFLEVKMPQSSASFDTLDDFQQDSAVTHQPVVAFIGEPFLHDTNRSSLPDIVVQGVHRGLYSYSDDV